VVEDLVPTFFTVGAAKSGTTSLHAYLAEHPDIAMTTTKEPSIFARDDWVENLPAYRGLFARAADVRGESSTAYSGFPYGAEVPDRVQATVPDAKIIYLVRDPVERALAQYAQMLVDNEWVRPFDELVEDSEHPLNAVVWASRYATQLRRWTERFGPNNVLVLDSRSLNDDRAGAIRTVLTFLEVDAEFTSERWSQLHNQTAGRRKIRRSLSGWSIANRLASGRSPLHRLVTTRIDPPVPTDAQLARLKTLLAPEAAELRRMTGLPLVGWSV
jgi:Sulfotransferase domain